MPDIPLTTIPWSETEELRVSINEYKGRDYFAVRVWFKGRDGNTMFPGKAGINVPVDRLEEFTAAIAKGAARYHTLQRRKGGKGEKTETQVDSRD